MEALAITDERDKAEKDIAMSIYKRLDSNSHEIRILELEYRGGRGRELMRYGRMRNESLIDIRPYTALSYCWGDPASDKFLRLSLCDGSHRNIPITDNLNSALLALYRRRGDKSEPSTVRVWVDAICINQEDFYERSQQVQMMRQIYSKAEEVIAWVGPTAESLLLSTHLSYLLDTKSQSEKAWQAKRTFFNEEYWKRVWIIQEITVASKVTMLYADHEFSWDFLVTVLESVLKIYSQGQKHHKIEASDVAAGHILKFREHWMDFNKPISLFQAMTWSLHTKATDPRDKIFALLGLCHDGFRFVPVPNYKQPLESIMSEMSRLTFSRSRSLDLMCVRGPPELYPKMPSWVPNWPILWSSDEITAYEKEILRSPTSFDFDPVLATSTDSTLEVEAVFIGKITAISSGLGIHTRKTVSAQASKAWLFTSELEGSINPDHPSVRRPISFRKLIWNTLTMSGPDLDVDRDSREAGECFYCLWTPQGRGSIYNTRIIDWLDENASFEVDGMPLRWWSQNWRPEPSRARSSWSSSLFSKQKKIHGGLTVDSLAGTWDAVNKSLEKVLGSGMRLAELHLAKQDGLIIDIALVNPQTATSDEIFALGGCSSPVVMRPVGQEKYEVIGALWIHGDEWRKGAYARNWSEGKIHHPPPGMTLQTLKLI